LCGLPQFAIAQGATPPWFLPTFINANGTAPNALGFVCTYSAGTTTPSATYSDIALTIANQNPIRLSAVGQPVLGSSPIQIYLGSGTSGGGSSYKFVEYAAGTGNTCNGTAVGTAIRTVDNITFGTVSNPAGSFTSGRVPYTTGTNTLADTANLVWDNTNQRFAVTGRMRALGAARVDPATGTSLDLLYDSNVDQAGIAAANWSGSAALKTLSITGNTVAILAASSGTSALSNAVASTTFDWGGPSIRGVTYRWPTTQGLVNTALCDDGSGNLSWGGCGSGGGGLTGGGVLNQIAFWTGGTSLGGNSLLTTDQSRYVTMTSSNALGSALIHTNSNTASTTSYAQFTADDGTFGGQNTVSLGITSPAFIGAPLASSQAYLQVPAAAGILAYTSNAAPFAFGINNAEVARFTSDATPAFSIGSTIADDAVQIPFQVVRASLTGSAIETRNSTSSTTSWAGFTAKSGNSGSSNNMVAGVTSASWVTSNGVTANHAFIDSESGSTGGMAIQTRNTANIFLEVNEVTKAQVTSNGLWINGVGYTWPIAAGGTNTVLTLSDTNGQLRWSAPAGSSGINGGGTSNFISKFTSGTTIGNSIAFDDGSTFYINATSGGSVQIPVLVQKNQNNASFFSFQNTTAGNISQAEVIVASDLANLAIGSTSSTFSTANNIPLLTGFINSSAANTGGMMIQANGGPLTFNPSGTTIATFTSAGIGIGVVSPADILNVAKDRTTNGTDDLGQIVISGSGATNDRLNLGYNTTADNGFIQSVHHNSANTPLLLNPNGGVIQVGGGSITPDDSTQIQLQVVNGSSTGTMVESRNSTSGATAFSQILAVAGAAGSQNNVSIGATSAGFSTANGVAANEGFIFSGSGATGGLIVQTRANAPIEFSINSSITYAMTLNTDSRLLVGPLTSTDSGVGQGRIIGLNGVTSLNAATNAVLTGLYSFGGGGGRSVLYGDSSGTGGMKPLSIVVNGNYGTGDVVAEFKTTGSNRTCIWINGSLRLLSLTGAAVVDGGACP